MLNLEGVSARYGSVIALTNVSIKVPKGSIVSLLGANGAGKSTTLKVISGLLKPTKGVVMYDDVDLTKRSVDKIVKMRIIHCPENRQVFPELTVLENLRIGSYVRKDRNEVKQDLEYVYSLFPRLSERTSQMAGTLSGGEQQMLAIARALMGKPELLLLDEPSLGLAPIIVQEIFKTIEEINRHGTSILLVEQNAHIALKVSHHAYVLENGRVALSGPAKELIHDERVSELYLGVKA